MKKLKILTLWLLVFTMVLSSVAVFAEDDTTGDVPSEEIQEESGEAIDADGEQPEEELTEEDILFELAETENIGPSVQETEVMTAEEREQQRADVETARLAQYQKLTAVLEDLGVYSFTETDGESIVTRGQFAKMVVDLFGLSDAPQGTGITFNDIKESPYKNEIELVYHYGIMNGVGDSSFAPDKEITYIQAVKTIVTALGYAPIAENWGGYKEGYIRVALDLKLLKGSNKDFDAPITFLTAANLITLSARSTVLETVGIQGNYTVYNEVPHKTVLSVYHNIYEDEGIMTDNGLTAITKNSHVGLNACVIGTNTLQGMKDIYRDYLGCNVKYFYRMDGSINTLLYATTDGVKNSNIVTLRASELMTDSSEFTASKVVAQVDGKKRSYTIYEYADFMYNGIVDATFHNDSMKIKSGTLTLIDADGDNVYELVKAWESSDIVVDTVLDKDEKIIAKYGAEEYSLINYGDYKVAMFEDVYGNQITADEIPSGSVLSVFASKGNYFVRMVLSTESKNITVTSTEAEEDEITVYYDGGADELSYTYFSLTQSDSAIYKLPKSGQSYKALYNCDGYIAMLTELDGREEYAYVLAMAYGTGIHSNKVEVKLYFESNNYGVVTVANKLSIDGVKNKTGADLMADTRIYKNGAAIPQLVKITLNSKGELNSICIDDTVDNSAFGFNLDEFSLDCDSGTSFYSDLSVSGLSDNKFVYRAYRVTRNTKIFLVLGDEKTTQTTSEESVRVISYIDYGAVALGGKRIKMYDADAKWECGAVVISETQGIGARFYTIDKVSHIIDEDGVDKLSLTGYMQNIYKVIREDEPGVLEAAVLARYPDSDGEVHSGDVFGIMQDIDGEINNAKLLYSPQRDNDTDFCFVDLYHSSSGTNMNSNNEIYILGYPVFIDGNIIGVYSSENSYYTPLPSSKQSGIGSPETFYVNPIGPSPAIMKYDCAEDTLEMITLSDLYSVGQMTSQGWEVADKSTKVFFRKTSGIIYDLYLVTNIGN